MISLTLSPQQQDVLFVGDIHGDVTALKAALEYHDELDIPVVFVGDYIDGYYQTRADQKKCLELVQDRHKEDDLYFLRGNHELSYQRPAFHKCSGYSSNFHRSIAPILNSIDFIDFLIVDNYILVTHGGLSQHFIYNEWSMGTDQYNDNDLMDFIHQKMRTERTNPKSKIFKIGHLSGGPLEVGGPFWCRPSVFKPFGQSIMQIFGHTASHHIKYYAQKRAFCIDSLMGKEKQVLLYSGEEETFSTANLFEL